MEQIQELITRVINGDMQAFEEIYQATYRQVYYTAFSFLKNEQNTLDVMQDTYITALTHLQQLENPERIVAWLNRIAVNKCKDFLMKKIPEPVEENSIDTELLEENDNFLPESYVLNAEKRKIILTIMQEELTAIQYQTILLYYFDGMIRIIIPLTMPGIIAGCLLVMLPAMGLFYVSDLMGGAKNLLIGNVIKVQFLNIRDWPFGAATSITLTIVMGLMLLVYWRASRLLNKKVELE